MGVFLLMGALVWLLIFRYDWKKVFKLPLFDGSVSCQNDRFFLWCDSTWELGIFALLTESEVCHWKVFVCMFASHITITSTDHKKSILSICYLSFLFSPCKMLPSKYFSSNCDVGLSVCQLSLRIRFLVFMVVSLLLYQHWIRLMNPSSLLFFSSLKICVNNC
jgi:hypothetical protein